MTMNEMRRFVGEQYKTDVWKQKVERMPENQVMALYYKFQAKPKAKMAGVASSEAHQLSFSDFGLECD